MARQMFFHECLTSEAAGKPPPSQLKILNWNIRNPSLKRAKQQAPWLIQTGANVMLLTEAKYSEGGLFLRDWLESYGFNVFLPQPKDNAYCVMVATQAFPCQKVELNVSFLSHRLGAIRCQTPLGAITIIGLYVPSRGPRKKRNQDKRTFQDQTLDCLRALVKTGQNSNLVLGGDLNIVEPNHFPRYPVFGEWEYEFYEAFLKLGLIDAYRLLHPDSHEYSWFGRNGSGYRLDHFLVSTRLSQYIEACSYIHMCRNLKLSDHSAMYLKMTKRHLK